MAQLFKVLSIKSIHLENILSIDSDITTKRKRRSSSQTNLSTDQTYYEGEISPRRSLYQDVQSSPSILGVGRRRSGGSSAEITPTESRSRRGSAEDGSKISPLTRRASAEDGSKISPLARRSSTEDGSKVSPLGVRRSSQSSENSGPGSPVIPRNRRSKKKSRVPSSCPTSRRSSAGDAPEVFRSNRSEKRQLFEETIHRRLSSIEAISLPNDDQEGHTQHKHNSATTSPSVERRKKSNMSRSGDAFKNFNPTPLDSTQKIEETRKKIDLLRKCYPDIIEDVLMYLLDQLGYDLDKLIEYLDLKGWKMSKEGKILYQELKSRQRMQQTRPTKSRARRKQPNTLPYMQALTSSPSNASYFTPAQIGPATAPHNAARHSQSVPSVPHSSLPISVPQPVPAASQFSPPRDSALPALTSQFSPAKKSYLAPIVEALSPPKVTYLSAQPTPLALSTSNESSDSLLTSSSSSVSSTVSASSSSKDGCAQHPSPGRLLESPKDSVKVSAVGPLLAPITIVPSVSPPSQLSSRELLSSIMKPSAMSQETTATPSSRFASG